MRVAVSTQVEDQMSNRVSRVNAVTEEFFEVPIPGYRLILLKSADQAVEGLYRNLEFFDRALQRHENGMGSIAVVHRFQLIPPPAEQLQTLPRVVDLVPQVVGPPAKRIDVVELLVQVPRQQKADHLEVLIVVS